MNVNYENETTENSGISDLDYALKLSEELNGNEFSSSIDSDYTYAVQLSKELSENLNEQMERNALLPNEETPLYTYYNCDSNTELDYQLSLSISRELNGGNSLTTADFPKERKMVKRTPPPTSEESNKKRKVNNYEDETMSVVDPSWETIDPNPDIYGLFEAFNKRFFWDKLGSVEVKWSSRMTTCAGICSYSSRAGFCSVRLSKPLLQFRQRKDTIETLLHEMIHAFLFVTKNFRDRDDHGPRFHEHMRRINAQSGANITVYHNFHDEVAFHKNHWWQCNGICRSKSPFYGMVKRATNRAPGPYDRWWNDHRAMCGGQFIKIKEPENYRKKSRSNVPPESAASAKAGKTNSLENYFNVVRPKPSAHSPATNNVTATHQTAGFPNLSAKSSNSASRGKHIVSLVDVTNSPSSSSDNWLPLSRKKNIWQFVNKS